MDENEEAPIIGDMRNRKWEGEIIGNTINREI